MAMRHRRTKLVHILFGSLLGGACGLLTIFDLSYVAGYLGFPVLTFWMVYAGLAWSILRPDWSRLLVQLPIFWIIYMLHMLFTFFFVVTMPLNAALVFLTGRYCLRMERAYGIWGWLVLLFFVGLATMIFFEPFSTISESLLEAYLVDGKDGAPGWMRGIILVWQTIMMTALTLQLHNERRCRQALAAQEVTSLDHDHPLSP